MDFGVDTIVYIILGLVFLVAQASKKKRSAMAKNLSDNEDVDSDDEVPPHSLLEEIFAQNLRDQSVEKTVEEKIVHQEAPPLLSSSYKAVDELVLENMSERKLVDLQKEEIADNSGDQRQWSTELQGFDLRKAVIYSAILERKYF